MPSVNDLYPYQAEAMERMSELFPRDIDNVFLEFNPTILPPFMEAHMRAMSAVIGIQSRQSGKVVAINDMEAVVARWGEADADPLRDIQEFFRRFHTDGEATLVVPLNGDLSQLETYALASLLHETGDPVRLDLDHRGGSIPGIADPIEKFKLALLPSEKHKSYLDHDPTKKHRRRRRG